MIGEEGTAMSKRIYKLPSGYTLFVHGKGTERQLRLSVSDEKESTPVYEEVVFETILDMVDRLERELEEAREIGIPRPIEEWDEDYGDVLWWDLPVSEPPYYGTPLDSDWPDYHTHWTQIVTPILGEEGG